MRDKMLKKLADWHARYPGRMLTVVIVITIIFAALSSQLSVTMRWSDLLPAKDKRTLAYNTIIDEFVAASSLVVVVQGDEQKIKSFADRLVPKLESAVMQTNDGPKNLIRRVDYKMNVDFIKKHGLMLIDKPDMKNMQELFTDPNLPDMLYNLNNAMEKQYVKRENPMSTRQKEDQAVAFLDGIQHLVNQLNRLNAGESLSESEAKEAVDRILIGDPYLLSYDKHALIINAMPTFSVMDLELVVGGVEVIQGILDDTLKEFPDVHAGLTGFMAVGHDEMVYSERSLGYTSLIAVLAILILLVVSFRMWNAPLFAIINLLIGILWAIGLVALLVGQLNIMTQMMAVILLGLGIDFSIHLISGFTEFRSYGNSIELALEQTFLKIGRGVITGGLTTACAFFTMVISKSRGMKEMGLVTGAGLLAILVATFMILPIFLVWREKRLERRKGEKAQKESRDISFRFLGNTGFWLSRHYGFTLIAALLCTAAMIWIGSKITFDQNYMNIEAKGLESVALQDTVLNKFDLGMDFSMVIAKSPENSHQLAEKFRRVGSVAMVDDISIYLPPQKDQKDRLPEIQRIKRDMARSPIKTRFNKNDWNRIQKEISRLRKNVIEMQSMAYLGGQDKVDNKCSEIIGDPDDPKSKDYIEQLLNSMQKQRMNRARWQTFQNDFAPYYKKTVLGMASSQSFSLKDLPESIVDAYSNSDRSRFLVTVFPAGSVWNDASFLRRFDADLERVDPNVTGMPPVFLALVEIIGNDGRKAMILTVIVVFLLLWADFRNPKHALMAMFPLIAGMAWMIGLMKLTGQQFTVMNVMGLPMILGIGIDDGVHIMHRWIAEGRGKIKEVFSSTGKAILLTTLTTMIGFGSLIFSVWRGFGQLGAALFVGVAACFITTVLFLAGLLGWIERKPKNAGK